MRLMMIAGILFALTVMAVGATADVTWPVTLSNDHATFVFQRAGSNVYLESVTRPGWDDPVTMAVGSGTWLVMLKNTETPGVGGVAVSPDPGAESLEGDRIIFQGEGAGNRAEVEVIAGEVGPEGPGSPKLMSADHVRYDESRTQALICAWTGQCDVDGHPVRFEVQTTWRLRDDWDAIECSIDIKTMPKTDASHYISSVQFPMLYIHQIDAVDQAVTPYIGGYLLENPIERANMSAGPEFSVMTDGIYGYYGEATRRCLYMSHTDTEGFWKHGIMRGVPDDRGGYFLWMLRHFPEDVFRATTYRTPYRGLIAPITGDWIDIANKYRNYMKENAKWYRGPVAGDENKMPERMKKTVVCALLNPGMEVEDAAAEHPEWYAKAKEEKHFAVYNTPEKWKGLMALRTDLLENFRRVVGDNIFTMWYGCHFPDRFDEFYREGYLPGRPNFARAVHETQDGTNIIVAPYIQGHAGYDYSRAPYQEGPPTEYNRNVLQAANKTETGQDVTAVFDHRYNVLMCAGDAWWNTELPRYVGEIEDATGIRGAYIDYFMPFANCYSDQHELHQPGGGKYTVYGKLDQLRNIKRQTSPDFAISIESCAGRYTEEVHLMYRNPFANWPSNAKTTSIPLFRFAHDELKMGQIVGSYVSQEEQYEGYASWLQAYRTLTCGQVLCIGNLLTRYEPSFQPGTGEKYQAFLATLAKTLNEPEFWRHHNGTMVRNPEVTVFNEGRFDVGQAAVAFPGYDKETEGWEAHGFDTPSKMRDYAPPYYLSVLPRGAWRSVDNSIMVAVANPWVRGCLFSDDDKFKMELTFKPEQYWQGVTSYTVSKNGKPAHQNASGDSVLKEKLRPGDVVYWIFTPEQS